METVWADAANLAAPYHTRSTFATDRDCDFRIESMERSNNKLFWRDRF
jgi:hypothetical protein